MTKKTYIAHLNASAPFGYKHEGNGTDFSRSVKDRNSNLCKVVRYVRDNCVTPVSRANILYTVLGVKSPKGQYTLLFSGMIKAGFLEKVGRGNATRYIEGRNAHLIPR